MSSLALTSSAAAGAGIPFSPGPVPAGWCSSTRPGSRPTWRRSEAGGARASACAFASHDHWRTLTFLDASRADRLTAPCVFDGPINGPCFHAYVEQFLVPALQTGDIVVMDNLGSHKSAAVRHMIQAAGARLWYVRPYSPDLDPIEQTFAKIKHCMRAAQKRTVDDTWRHIGSLIATIPPDECSNYFANTGYASAKT